MDFMWKEAMYLQTNSYIVATKYENNFYIAILVFKEYNHVGACHVFRNYKNCAI